MIHYLMEGRKHRAQWVEPTRVAGGILWIFGLVKWVTVITGYNALDMRDPVTGVEFRLLFLVVGAVEIIIGALTVSLISRNLAGWVISAFAVGAMAYHGAQSISGGDMTCPCMGFLTDWIPLPKEDQSQLSLGLAVWMWVVGVATLVAEVVGPIKQKEETANEWVCQ